MSLTTALCSPTVPLQRHARLAAGSPAAQQPLAGPWQRQRRQERRSAPCAATASLAVLADFTAGPAAASEAFIDTTAGIPDVGQSPEAARVAAEAAADAAANDPANIVFTVLFATAIAALVVVTLGVAYLSFTTWNDGRVEEEDRRRAEKFSPSSSGTPAGAKKAAAKKEAAPKAPEEFKGFGKK